MLSNHSQQQYIRLIYQNAMMHGSGGADSPPVYGTVVTSAGASDARLPATSGCGVKSSRWVSSG